MKRESAECADVKRETVKSESSSSEEEEEEEEEKEKEEEEDSYQPHLDLEDDFPRGMREIGNGGSEGGD